MPVYDIGDDALLTAVFRDAVTGDLLDPSAVYLKVREPSTSTVTTYQYGVDVALTRSGTGTYTLTQSCAVSGTYQYRWYSTGTGKAAQEGQFDVRPSAF